MQHLIQEKKMMRECKICKQNKDINEFYTKHAKCKSCYKQFFARTKEERREYRRSHYIKNRERLRKIAKDYYDEYLKHDKEKRKLQKIKYTHHLDKREYYDLIEKSNGLCNICKKSFENKPHIDHDHLTGRIRGVLCNKCNLGIGLLCDDINILTNAIDYLKDNGKMPINTKQYTSKNNGSFIA